MNGPMSPAVMVPLLVTVLVVTLAVVATAVTVMRDKRHNAVLATRWATVRRNHKRAPVALVARAADKRSAA